METEFEKTLFIDGNFFLWLPFPITSFGPAQTEWFYKVFKYDIEMQN